MPTGQQYSSIAAQTTLTGSITSGTDTCNVASTSGFPSSTPFTICLDIGQAQQELCDVTGVTGLQFTLARGIDSSSASSHNFGATVTHVDIARDFREARAHIDASSSNDSTGHSVHGIQAGSSVVGTTDTQTLTNKTLGTGTVFPNPVTDLVVGNTGSSDVPLTVNTTGGGTGDTFEIQVGGTTVVKSNPLGPTLTVTPSQATNTGLRISGAVSQTADLENVKDSSGNNLVRITANGASGAGAIQFTPTDTGNPSFQVTAPADLVVQKIFRGTDSSPAQNMLEFWNHANSTRLAYVDPNGVYNGPNSNGLVLLASATGTGSSGSFVFSSISQSYSNLLVVASLHSTDTTAGDVTNVGLTFNSLAGTSYNFQALEVNAATVTGSSSNGAASWPAAMRAGNSSGAANACGSNTLWVDNYAGTTLLKNFYSQSSVGRTSGTNSMYLASGLNSDAVNGVAAVTSLTFTAAVGNFTAASKISLYGVL